MTIFDGLFVNLNRGLLSLNLLVPRPSFVLTVCQQGGFTCNLRRPILILSGSLDVVFIIVVGSCHEVVAQFLVAQLQKVFIIWLLWLTALTPVELSFIPLLHEPLVWRRLEILWGSDFMHFQLHRATLTLFIQRRWMLDRVVLALTHSHVVRSCQVLCEAVWLVGHCLPRSHLAQCVGLVSCWGCSRRVLRRQEQRGTLNVAACRLWTWSQQ